MSQRYFPPRRDPRQDMEDATLTTTLVLDAYGDKGKVASYGDRVVTDGYEGYIRTDDGEVIVVGPEYLSAHEIKQRRTN